MTQPGAAQPFDPALPSHAGSHARRRSLLLQAGGGLGIAAFSIALLIFLATCFGFGAALFLSVLPLVMGLVGLVLTVIGGVIDKHAEGSDVAAALFINVGAIAGALLAFAVWMEWPLFA
jgi:uncharacterized membrane protein